MTISPRMFNARFKSRYLKHFKRSKGFQRDVKSLGPKTMPTGIVHGKQLEAPNLTAWGTRIVCPSKFSATDTPDRHEAFLKQIRGGRFIFDEARFEAFERWTKEQAKRGVNLLLVTVPMHYVNARSTSADDDGTPDAAYDSLVQRLRKLERDVLRVAFVDAHRDGLNEYEDADFLNFDHLSVRGRKRFSSFLERVRKSRTRLIERRLKLQAVPFKVPKAKPKKKCCGL